MAVLPFIVERPDCVLLTVKLQPRAARNEIGKMLGNELRIKVTAPPVDNAANEALIRFLADRLGISRSRVELARGQTSRHKVLRIRGVQLTDVLNRLKPLGEPTTR